MVRILLNYILPLALPTLIYLGWMWYLRNQSKARGDELPEIKSVPLFASILTGVLLMFAGLIYVAATSGEPPGEGFYEAPRFDEDGNLIPPKFK